MYLVQKLWGPWSCPPAPEWEVSCAAAIIVLSIPWIIADAALGGSVKCGIFLLAGLLLRPLQPGRIFILPMHRQLAIHGGVPEATELRAGDGEVAGVFLQHGKVVKTDEDAELRT